MNNKYIYITKHINIDIKKIMYYIFSTKKNDKNNSVFCKIKQNNLVNSIKKF